MSLQLSDVAVLLESVRQAKPLVHQITNYVTVNDCANITLAIGASPVMADDIDEVLDIVNLSSALVLNIGTLNRRTVASMLSAGKAGNKKGIPIVLDPVGAGASRLRSESAAQLLEGVRLAVIRGNLSEIYAISGSDGGAKGVDVSERDLQKGLESAMGAATALAKKQQCVVAVTGKTDIVTDGQRTFCVENGHPLMSSITGTGCMCSALVGAFCGTSEEPLLAALSAVLCMGVAGEIAHEHAGDRGNGSYHAAILDAISLLSEETLLSRGRFYEA